MDVGTPRGTLDELRTNPGARARKRQVLLTRGQGSPATEWLVDNFHIADKQLREIRDDLPGTITACPNWPRVTSRGHPRVLGIAWAYFARRRSTRSTPTLDHSDLDPGDVKGYLPGVRENGGQYTHAAIWSVIAYATLGDGDRTSQLLLIRNPVNHAGTGADVHWCKADPDPWARPTSDPSSGELLRSDWMRP